MKKVLVLLAVSTLVFSAQSQAEGWLDSLKNLFGMGDETTQQASPNVNDMVAMLSKNLGVNQNQAEGGLGSIFNYAKDNMNNEQFVQLANVLPGVSDLIKAAPDVSKLSESTGLSGLMDKAADYSESLKAINTVKKQFEALGLNPDMIIKYIDQAKQYLDTPEGQKAKQLLNQNLGKLLGG